MHRHGVRHHICELSHAIFFLLRVKFVNNFSTFNSLPVHQPFGTVMEKSGVEARSSEQTMLSDEAHVLLVTDSSSEMDSETDDQSYSPIEVYALTWHGYSAHIMNMVSCIAYFRHHIHNIQHHVLSSDIIYANGLYLAYKSHM